MHSSHSSHSSKSTKRKSTKRKSTSKSSLISQIIKYGGVAIAAGAAGYGIRSLQDYLGGLKAAKKIGADPSVVPLPVPAAAQAPGQVMLPGGNAGPLPSVVGKVEDWFSAMKQNVQNVFSHPNVGQPVDPAVAAGVSALNLSAQQRYFIDSVMANGGQGPVVGVTDNQFADTNQFTN